MNGNVYYEVEILEGRTFFGKAKTKSSFYFDNNPFLARKSAFEFVTSLLHTNKTEECHIDHQNAGENSRHKSKPLSVVIYFVKCKVEKYQVYGAEVHETIYGLHQEALYYRRNGLICDEDLKTVLQNKDSEDIYNPAFFISHEPKEFPYIDFNIVKVLPQNLNFILPRNKYSLSASEV